MKNDGVTARYGSKNSSLIDIRDDQIFQYFMTGTDETNTYYDAPSLANYTERVIDIAEFMSMHPLIIEVIVSHKLTGSNIQLT